MDKLKNKIMSHLESRYTLDPLPVPDDLKEIKRFLGVFKLNMYNWKMEKVRKISVMRCSVLPLRYIRKRIMISRFLPLISPA